MSIASISAAGLSQEVLAASNSGQQQALQTLQDTLASGDLTGAQSAFQTLQNILQNSTTASGNTLSSNSQLSTDLTALGGALSSGDLSTAQSAFATVLGDLKTTASPALINEVTAASQSVQLVDELLSTVDSSLTSSSTADDTTSLLEAVYGSQSGLSVLA
jgi:hypothetical protein